MNSKGIMKGNKETLKGKMMEKKHSAKLKSAAKKVFGGN